MKLDDITLCRRYIGQSQMAAMLHYCNGEEGDWFRQKIADLARLFRTMPKVYEQESLGEYAVVHLHYFTGSADWYITERDQDGPQHQAFGLADLFGDGGELGYISIAELIRCGAELDLHWRPRTLAAVRALQPQLELRG